VTEHHCFRRTVNHKTSATRGYPLSHIFLMGSAKTLTSFWWRGVRTTRIFSSLCHSGYTPRGPHSMPFQLWMRG